MNLRLSVLGLVAVAGACSSRTGENSAICGITMLASATSVVEQLNNVHAALTEPPEGLLSGYVPARVVGYGTRAALAGTSDSGLVVGYDGEGFPQRPGFGVALVDDSSEVFRGILIWDSDPPPDTYPLIGQIVGDGVPMPLIGLRINWGSVNSERCPLFGSIDSLIP